SCRPCRSRCRWTCISASPQPRCGPALSAAGKSVYIGAGDCRRFPMIQHAIQHARLLPLLGTFAFLSACEQPTQIAVAQEQSGEDVVLPGTENMKDFGDYVLHFNAIGTDQLTDRVAAQYGIVRSRNRAMLSV